MATSEQQPKADALSSNDTHSSAQARQNPDAAAKTPAPPEMRMTDNGPAKAGTAGDTAAAAGIPFYEKRRQELKELIARKRALEKRLVCFPFAFPLQNRGTDNRPPPKPQAAEEDSIYQKETEYLETTPAGNIVVGFDNYAKGTGSSTAAAAARRKTGLTEQNRVFSRSSISYNPNNVGSL